MIISSDDRFNSVEEFWRELNSQTPQQEITPLQKSETPAKDHVFSEQQPEPLKTSAPALHQHARPPVSRKSAFFFIILAAILTIAIGTALFLFALQHKNTSSISPGATPTLATTTPSSNVTTGVSAYPDIGSSYVGTVLDLMNYEKTSLYLTQIHQNKGNITGYFKGLGMAGPFTGTVTHTGHLQFTVVVQSGSSFLSFEGDIKIGGDITGGFRALNQQRQFTGEAGIWNASLHQ